MAMDGKTKASLAFFAVTAGSGAFFWWKGKQMAKPPLVGVAPFAVKTVEKTDRGTTLVTQVVELKLTPEQKTALAIKAANRAQELKRPILPVFKVVSGFMDESRLKSGMLGKIVAAYWGYWHTRLWYMTRCRQYHPFDDTASYLELEDKKGHKLPKSLYFEKLDSDRGEWPVGVHGSFADTRFSKEKPEQHNHYRRYLSLDRTFPNWSMPWGGFEDVFSQAGRIKSSYPQGSLSLECFIDCGWRRGGNPYAGKGIPTNSKCISKDCGSKHSQLQPYSSKWSSEALFKDGKFNGNSISRQIILGNGYRWAGPYWEENSAFAGVVEKPFQHIQLPGPAEILDLPLGYKGRIWGKVSTADRLSATYSIKKIPDSFYRKFYKQSSTKEKNDKDIATYFKSSLISYYAGGYNLVNTVLDVLIDRGYDDLEKKFPKFIKHCNWWWILPPDKSMLRNVKDKDSEIVAMPRLKDISSGDAGFGDVSSEDLVNYVMRITPPPGTIPPWEDRGPLWMWPSSAGQMRPFGADSVPYPAKFDSTTFKNTNYTFLRSSKSSKWSSWQSAFAYIDMTVKQAVVDYLMGAAGSAASSVVSSIVVPWVENLGSELLDGLSAQLGANFPDVLDLASKIATYAGMVEKFNVATAIGYIKPISGSYLSAFDTLNSYLTDVTDGRVDSIIRSSKGKLDIAMQELREWGWADDLIGDMASVGTDFYSGVTKQAKGAALKFGL